MANPPFSGSVLILYENQDGINVRVYHYADVLPGTPIPKGIVGLETALFNALTVPPDNFVHRHFSTRTTLKTGFGQFIDASFPDTTA